MKIRHRLSLQFTLISGIILSVIFAAIYLLFAGYVSNSFYKILQVRALITAQVYLEEDELTKKKFKEIEASYQQSIPDESSNIYNAANEPVFIEKVKYKWPPELLETIREKKLYRFTYKDKPAIGMFYPDNQGDFVVIIAARNKAGQQQLGYLLWILVGTFCLGVLVIFIMGQWYARKALQPINNINRQMKKIRSNNLHLRVKSGRNKDEVDELATNFNQLLEHLEGAFELQKSFVSNASHELRTPLTSIIGEIEVTLQRNRNAEEYLQSLRSVLDESVKLKTITDGLLQLTRVDFDLDTTHLEEVRLDELLWELQQYWRSKTPARVLEVQLLHMPEDAALLAIKGNRQLLTLALQNIIKNGFKFSYDQPVTCILDYNSKGMLLTISDKGIGIAPAEQERIFLPLYRAANAHAFAGFGVGLPMAQKILQLHHATITVQSEMQQGTTFSIFFALG
ncbi:HAMP domain-containing sensor histidine kinase [Chitinophaga defluvii]|uniref:histidine kinase n=1 Tax=Chitinophaga defluvii TaxID=3163343 RepID=A0ABV2T676_9BACT